ncbi:MAG: hypothetical protein ACI9BV_003605, partial [Rhodothermales bacterium]
RMEMTAGRTFDPGRTLDSANVIINESAALKMGFGLFLATGLGMLVLTYATVGLQSVRAAVANPARSLRSE